MGTYLNRLGRQKARIALILTLGTLIVISIHNISSLSDPTLIKEKVGEYASKYVNKVDEPLPVSSLTASEVKERQTYWSSIFKLFLDHEPTFTDGIINDVIQYTDKSQRKKGKTKAALLSRATISSKAISEFSSKHLQLVEDLPDSELFHTYREGTTGITMVGGGRFSWLAYLSIRGLRAAGLNLPVEVILPTMKDFENEKELCTQVFPKINATCIAIPEVLGPEVMSDWSGRLSSYQFKALGLIASSFQHVLLLDSDNIPVQRPEMVFESSLYKDFGMISWPDYWERTVSPHYYDIAKIRVNEKRRIRYKRMPVHLSDEEDVKNIESVPFHDLEGTIPSPATESGQLFIDKALHGKTVLLSLYYNVYGPKLYYKLFSLGEPGEGDKDTFLAAAVASEESFYPVKSKIRTYGYFNDKSDFCGVAMGQKNPLIDYQKFRSKFIDTPKSDKVRTFKEQATFIDEVMGEFDSHDIESVMFLHCNFPKLEPSDLKSKGELYDEELKRLRYRIYNGLTYYKPKSTDTSAKMLKSDFELDQWTVIHNTICEDKIDFPHLRDKNIEELCEFTRNQVTWLRENTKH